MWARGPAPTAPCGTPAAARRHYRHGEPLCDACKAAVSVTKGSDPYGVTADPKPDPRPVRNGLPVLRPYRYGGAAAWRASAAGDSR